VEKRREKKSCSFVFSSLWKTSPYAVYARETPLEMDGARRHRERGFRVLDGSFVLYDKNEIYI
jgi:hypothetical protein